MTAAKTCPAWMMAYKKLHTLLKLRFCYSYVPFWLLKKLSRIYHILLVLPRLLAIKGFLLKKNSFGILFDNLTRAYTLYFRHEICMYQRFNCNILFAMLSLLLLPACGGRKRHKLTKQEREKIRVEHERPHKNKKIERMTLEEALEVYPYYKRHHKTMQSIMTIERIISLTTDH